MTECISHCFALEVSYNALWYSGPYGSTSVAYSGLMGRVEIFITGLKNLYNYKECNDVKNILQDRVYDTLTIKAINNSLREIETKNTREIKKIRLDRAKFIITSLIEQHENISRVINKTINIDKLNSILKYIYWGCKDKLKNIINNTELIVDTNPIYIAYYMFYFSLIINSLLDDVTDGENKKMELLNLFYEFVAEASAHTNAYTGTRINYLEICNRDNMPVQLLLFLPKCLSEVVWSYMWHEYCLIDIIKLIN